MSTVLKTLLLACATLAMIPTTYAQTGYESILQELSASQVRTRSPEADPFDMVKIHGGVGLANSFFQLPGSNDRPVTVSASGIQLSLGIDLFSRHWMAEGSIRNYGETSDERHSFILREFDLKLVYRMNPNGLIRFHNGLGLTGRYLTLGSGFDHVDKSEYVTPSGLVTLGATAYFTDFLSLGAEVAGRLAMISETVDKGSMDIIVRLGTHF